MLQPPVLPTPTEVDLTDAPEIPLEMGEAPRLVSVSARPARPRVAPSPVVEPAPAEKVAEPMIVPDLTTEELAAAKSATQHSLDVAQSNLSQTQGKKLNLAQEDVASKIRGFIDSAREAMRNEDWPRARTQAKKAEVLSQELTGNL